MTQLCVCDRCQAPATEGTFTLSGWWHLVTESKKSRPAKPKGETRLQADICPSCIEQLGIRTNLELTRRGLYLKWMKDNPGSSPIKGLRKTAIKTEYVEDVFCNSCELECSQQYVRLESTWETEAQEKVYIDLCPLCFESAKIKAQTIPLDSESMPQRQEIGQS